ncbi:MAG: hypothetical protein RL596_2661, partial [Bacteroidota bacterium]
APALVGDASTLTTILSGCTSINGFLEVTVTSPSCFVEGVRLRV